MTASYETSLHEAGFDAVAYLKQRGIERETAASYRLGIVNDKWPEHEPYQGMLAIPYRTKLGGVVSLKFRRAHDCTEGCQHAKYISPYPTRLYNTIALDEADREGFICVTEGEIDAIILDSCGFPAIGIPGVESWKAHPEWGAVLAGYPRVHTFVDPDEPGDRLGKSIAQCLGPGVRTVRLPRDVNDYYREHGRDEFKRRINERIQDR
jgi:DNA primase